MGLSLHLDFPSNVVRTFDIRAIYLEVPATDHVDQIAIATLYLLVMMVMAVLIRLAFRLFMLRSLQWDDMTVSLSLLFGIAQSSTIFAGTRHGLGKTKSALGEDDTSRVEKYLYASELLYIVSLSLAKISVLQFIDKLNVNKLHKKTCFFATITIFAWADSESMEQK
ncbi:hypothetical protein N7523_000241 [Penicillium sp. IBT 18751x]|nr:hypothetical protein N7523_000241 [Penicillium sp. IBT 18751x]